MNQLVKCKSERQITQQQSALALHEPRFGEPRVDSRTMAKLLGEAA